MIYFDRFDIVGAYYLFFVHYHEGGGSRRYQRLSKISTYFKPSRSLADGCFETENQRAIYRELVLREEGEEAVSRDDFLQRGEVEL